MSPAAAGFFSALLSHFESLFIVKKHQASMGISYKLIFVSFHFGKELMNINSN